MKLIIFLFTFLILIHVQQNRVLLRTGSIKLRNSSKELKKLLNKDFKVLMERRLLELKEQIPEQVFKIPKKDNYKKVKFMRVIANILKEAKARKLNIKSIKLGRKIRNIFENKDISKIMMQYINDPKFFQKYRFEEKKYKSFLQKNRRLRQIRDNKIQNQQRKLRYVQEMPNSFSERRLQRGLRGKKGGSKGRSSRGGGSKGGGESGNMEFQMSGDMSQMPFPPMVMNGPHYHPPMNITINQLPNMNPRTERNPIELQLSEYKSQTEQLDRIFSELTKVGGTVPNFEKFNGSIKQMLDTSFNSVKDKAIG